MNPTNPQDAVSSAQDGPRTLPDTQSATMSPEAQRIAIAEVCGWKPIRQHWEKDGVSAFLNESINHLQLPDYLSNLNAMHEAEKVLATDQAWVYSHELSKLQGTAAGIGSGAMDQWSFHATAAQRAEAFLRTLGKWEPQRDAESASHLKGHGTP